MQPLPPSNSNTFLSPQKEAPYPLRSHLSLLLPSQPASGNHSSLFCVYGFACRYGLTQYLAFGVWLLSLIMFSRLVRVSMVALCFFLLLIPLYRHTTFVYLFISSWIFTLFPLWGYCEQCYSKLHILFCARNRLEGNTSD